MNRLLTTQAVRSAYVQSQVAAISATIAQSMLGRMVSVHTGNDSPTHGVVTGVVLKGGRPKIEVNAAYYDVRQVLTVMPPSFQKAL